MKFKKGDLVKITLGKDKGREGKIENVFAKKGTVLIPGINMYKKHVKAMATADGKGGIFDIPRALPLSKIALICPSCKKMTRVGYKVTKGEKVRVCKKCGKEIK